MVRRSIVDLPGGGRVGRVLSEGSASLRNVSSNGEAALVARLRADLYELVAVDVVSLPDATLRSELVELLAAANQLNAAIAARVASFDTRGLADDDACRTTAVWLRCYGRYTDGAASRMVKQARVLRELPAVAEAAGRGEVTAEHVDQIAKLAKQVGVEAVRAGRPDPGRRRRQGDRGRPRAWCATGSATTSIRTGRSRWSCSSNGN